MLWFSLLQTKSIVGKINNAEQKKKKKDANSDETNDRVYGKSAFALMGKALLPSRKGT